jgi:hypothetical protein
MVRITLLLGAALVFAACGALPALPFAAARPAGDPAGSPPADTALTNAGAAMGRLKALRELVSTRTYRNDELFLSLDAERAYVAPDRKYERVEGRSAVDAVGGETVQIGALFYKRVGPDAPWQQFPWTDSLNWPGNEYTFSNLQGVSYAGTGDVEGRPARILLLKHEGSAESHNAGWQFETRLWIDPDSQLVLRRETRGTRNDPDPSTGAALLQRYEATWQYKDPDGSIAISAPLPTP